MSKPRVTVIICTRLRALFTLDCSSEPGYVAGRAAACIAAGCFGGEQVVAVLAHLPGIALHDFQLRRVLQPDKDVAMFVEMDVAAADLDGRIVAAQNLQAVRGQ